MNLFNDLGFIDIPAIRKACPKAFLFVLVGARRTGKTYGILDDFHNQQEPYIFMRLTQEEMKYTCSSKVNMFLENQFPWADHMTIGDGKPLYLYDDEFDENLPVGMALALSDVAKIRGYGAKRYNNIFLDEFIPEDGAYVAKGIGDALKNAYMTINGNRELMGQEPVKLWLAANSNNLNNDILSAFNLTSQLLLMQKRQQSFCYMPERRTCLILIDKSPISARLQRTALFDCIGRDDKFSRMAIENVFINDDSTGVKSCPIKEYQLMCGIDNILLYRHKSRLEWYIVQDNRNKAKIHYNSSNPTSYNAFLRAWHYQGLITPIDGETIFYNCYTAKITAYRLLKLDKNML